MHLKTSLDKTTFRVYVLTVAITLCATNSTNAQQISGAKTTTDGLAAVHSDDDHSHDDHVHFRVMRNRMFVPAPRLSPHVVHPPGAADALEIDPYGYHRKLILLLRFKGHEDRELPKRADYETLLNKINGDATLAPYGSALDYSREISYGKLTISCDVVDWIDLPETEQYYANNQYGDQSRMGEAITYALDYAERNNLVDFRDFDRSNDGFVDIFGVIHSGYGAEFSGADSSGHGRTERIWSHKSGMKYWQSKSGVYVSDYACSTGLRGVSGSKPCRVGLIAHEVAHIAGLPDLYGNAGKGEGSGIGCWGLLGFSDGFLDTGFVPTHFSPWAKNELGWVRYKDLKESRDCTIGRIEEYSDVFRIQEGFPNGEYLVIENRNPLGFDSEIPGHGGLAIWHIDENKKNNRQPGHPGIVGWPENGAHYKVALIQADGKYDLEKGLNYGDAGDLFVRGGVSEISSDVVPEFGPYQRDPNGPRIIHRISNISAPGRFMSFRYDIERLPRDSSSVDEVLSQSSQRRQSAGPRFAATAGTYSPSHSAGSNDQGDDSEANQVLQARNLSPVIHAAGIPVTSVAFEPGHDKHLSSEGVLLQCRFDLAAESAVHVTCHATVAGQVDGNIVTGIKEQEDSEAKLWRTSVRAVSVSAQGQASELSLNCRRRLPAGSHTIYWVIKSEGRLSFPAGGQMLVKAFE